MSEQRPRLAGRHLLITGGGRGIGRALALAAARAGADVSVASRTATQVEAVAERVRALGRRASAIAADVSLEADAQRIVDRAHAEVGPIDVLVNNAGCYVSGPLSDLPVAEFDRVMATNLRGAFLVTQAALASLIARRSGDIVFMSSTSGKRGDAGASAYAASKFGLMGLAACLVQELRHHDIRVLVLSPSSVDTTSPPQTAASEGRGARLHADDVAEAVIAALALPGRALVREIELWNTNP